MNRFKRFRGREKLHPAALTALVLLLACFLLRLLTLSFSVEIGQAKKNIGTMLIHNLCINIMESGSSLIGYQSEEEASKPLLAGILSREYALYENTEGGRAQPYLIEESGGYRLEADGIAKTTDKGFAEPVNDTLATGEGIAESVKDTAATEAAVMNDGSNMKGNEDRNYMYYPVTGGRLTREFILTNGAAYDESSFSELVKADSISGQSQADQLSVGVLDGDVYMEQTDNVHTGGEGSSVETMRTNSGTAFTMEQLKDVGFLIRNFYIVDPDTSITDSLFHSEEMLGKDMTIKQGNDAPQILIYHTHSQEAYIDSRKGMVEDTVVGVGTYLTEILEEEYGYNVIHDTSTYDIMGGDIDRNKAYNYAKDGVSKILEENPTIEVIIDLHRDGSAKRSTELDGKETAQIMLFNGLCRNTTGPLASYDNPNLKDNLAFSLQLQLKSLEKYPGLFYKNYLHSYRYNLHLRPKSILVELGTNYNTLDSARNAMEPFAEILDAVLKGE